MVGEIIIGEDPTEQCLCRARSRAILVQHVGFAIEHASMMFSRLVSLIRVFLFCRAENRQL